MTLVPPTVLRGALVLIRPFEPSDAQALFDLRARNRDDLRPFEPSSVVVPETVAMQRERIEQERREWAEDRSYTFAVVRPDDDLLVGRVQLSQISRGAWQNAVLGYYVDAAQTGRGYATEAALLALRFAFEDAGLHRVQAGVMPRNAPSLRVLAKAGLRHEGTARRYLEIAGVWEDHEIFAITREEWADRSDRSVR